MLKASRGYIESQIEMAEAFDAKAVKDIFCFEETVFRSNGLPDVDTEPSPDKIKRLRRTRGNASLLRPKFVVINGKRFKVKQTF